MIAVVAVAAAAAAAAAVAGHCWRMTMMTWRGYMKIWMCQVEGDVLMSL